MYSNGEEINSLRRQNEKMRDRLEMFDNIMCILYGTPGHANTSGMMAPDIAYEIKKRIEEINSQQE